MENKQVKIRSSQEMGLPDCVARCEDGMRTSAKSGNYEWWYFDSKYPDGSSLVIVFYTKPMTSMKGTLEPYVSLDYLGADGTQIHTSARSEQYSFSTEECDVRIGHCHVKGDLSEYSIHFQNEEVTADLKLTATVPSWRPYSGHIFFGESNYFAWLPSVPEGTMIGSLHKNGRVIPLEGTGYHDHNWGNKLMIFLMNDWYWGRAKVGDYVVVSSYIYANKKYGYAPTPIFMLAKNGEIICEDAYQYLKYTEQDFYIDPYTKRNVARTLIYDFDCPDSHYRVTYRKGNEDVERKTMTDVVGSVAAKLFYLAGFRGSYHRMGGTCIVEKIENGVVVESQSQSAMWEQMCFGPDRIR